MILKVVTRFFQLRQDVAPVKNNGLLFYSLEEGGLNNVILVFTRRKAGKEGYKIHCKCVVA